MCVRVCVLVLVGYLGAFALTGGSVLVPPHLYIYVPNIRHFENSTVSCLHPRARLYCAYFTVM
jgi:hypothetical protein